MLYTAINYPEWNAAQHTWLHDLNLHAKPPAREWWGDIHYAHGKKKTLQTLEFMQFQCVIITMNIQRLFSFFYVNLPGFYLDDCAWRHRNPPLPVSCCEISTDHDTIQAGPNVYRSKVKLLTMQYALRQKESLTSAYGILPAELCTQHSSAQHRDTEYKAWWWLKWMNKTTARCQWHVQEWLTINLYILYAA